MAAQAQQTALNHDRKTIIIVIAVVAVATVIYMVKNAKGHITLH